ncbi:MAG: hypothetical protein AAFX52_04745 [Pseudomonadota bacterium]
MIFASLLSALALSSASSNPEEILDVLDRFFVALERADADAMRSMVEEGTLLTSLRRGEDDVPATQATERDDWIGSLDGLEGVIVELYWSPKVEVSPVGLAHAWVPYVVEANGERVHCGVDAFTLIKRESGWRISGLYDTRDPHGCDRLSLEEGRETMRPAALRAKLKS